MSVYYAYDNSPFLSHHGTKGMHWGVRRYQNPDGTLTEEGKKRYGVKNGSSNSSKFVDTQRAFAENVNDATRDKNNEKRLAKKLFGKKGDKKIGDLLVDNRNAFRDYGSKYEQVYKKYSDKMKKETGREWDGDGTEESWELEKRYPEYAKALKNYNEAKKKYVNALLDISQAGFFDDVFPKVKDLKSGDLKIHGNQEITDGKAYVAALILNGYEGSTANSQRKRSDNSFIDEVFDLDFQTRSWPDLSYRFINEFG